MPIDAVAVGTVGAGQGVMRVDGATILVVDDEPANLAVLSRLLSPSYTVRVSKSGEAALAALAREPYPDLVLLDVMMPGLDGYGVLAHMKQDERVRDLPVIFVTSLEGDREEERGFDLGAVDYITKPVSPPVVLARVRAHLELKRARDELARQNEWLEAEVARRVSENALIQDVSLGLLAELTESRDTDTGNHILRTQAYVGSLARRLQGHPRFAPGLDESSLERIVKASPLHDIGKIAIPDRILLKPGPLDPDEWEVMKSHARLGGDVVARAIEKSLAMAGDRPESVDPASMAFLEEAGVIAVSHHERWDGSGYPDGLAGEAIPLAGRLMALADVYDALATPRAYKEAWSLDAAAEYVLGQGGAHFDPDIVDAFRASRAEFERIHDRLADPAAPRGIVL